jgi:hypothetical protein
MSSTDAPRFTVEVKLMDDPCLWRWEIKDSVRGAVVQSSWEQEWTAYPSREEAFRAGYDRLRSVSQRTRSQRFGSWRFGATD